MGTGAGARRTQRAEAQRATEPHPPLTASARQQQQKPLPRPLSDQHRVSTHGSPRSRQATGSQSASEQARDPGSYFFRLLPFLRTFGFKRTSSKLGSQFCVNTCQHHRTRQLSKQLSPPWCPSENSKTLPRTAEMFAVTVTYWRCLHSQLHGLSPFT